jgi:hypothetical protein
MFKYQIRQELKDTVNRIQKYLMQTELSSDRVICGRNVTYLQQLGKLTAYLYFLWLLGEYKFVNKLQEERGRTIVDEKMGGFIDTLPYLQELKQRFDMKIVFR